MFDLFVFCLLIIIIILLNKIANTLDGIYNTIFRGRLKSITIEEIDDKISNITRK